MSDIKDEYNRIIECPKCGSHELDVEYNIHPHTISRQDHVYSCRICQFTGTIENFRAIPEECDNPSRR